MARGRFPAIDQRRVVQVARTWNVPLGKMLCLAEVDDAKTVVAEPGLKLIGADHHGGVINGWFHWALFPLGSNQASRIVLVFPASVAPSKSI